jgi:chromatin segregation and condensation protein Rec8/ScpA/Scc1 (kleisin family)
LFALLELYKLGEAAWEQSESFGEIAVRAPHEPFAGATGASGARARLAG